MTGYVLSHLLATMGLLFLPIVAYAIYKGRRIKHEIDDAERLGLPFTAPPAPTPSVLLRGLLPEERVYAEQQLKLAVSVYLFLLWLSFVEFSIPVFNPLLAPKWSDPTVLMWQEFLLNTGRTTSLQGSMLALGAFLAIVLLRIGGDGRFYRTRPLRVGFLYAWRVLPILAALLAGIATGLALACGLLYLLHGAIWAHLPPSIPRALGPDDADVVEQYRNLLSTSVSAMSLSMLTTDCLFFSGFVALGLLPVKRWSQQGIPLYMIPVAMLAVISPLVLITLSDFGQVHLPKFLFIYQRLGPSPAIGFALGPVATAAALLLLGRVFVSHVEL